MIADNIDPCLTHLIYALLAATDISSHESNKVYYVDAGIFWNNHDVITMAADALAVYQSGTKPNLVAKILATKFGSFCDIYIMLWKICSILV